MSGRSRWALGAIALLAAAGVIVYALLNLRPHDAEQPAAPAAMPVAAHDAPPTTTPDTPSAVAPANAPAAPPEEKQPAREGQGRIYGTALLPADAPRGLPISIALHWIQTHSLDVSYDDTLQGTATADAQGSYEFSQLPLGEYILFATAPGYVMRGEAFLTEAEGRLGDEVNFDLVPGGTVSGRVMDSAHKPVEGAQVFVAGWNVLGQKRAAWREIALASRVKTGADGAFTIGNLRKAGPSDPGYQLGVRAAGHATFVSEYIPEGTEGVEFVLSEGVTVAGQLVDVVTNAAVPERTVALNAEAVLNQITAKSDAEGYFFLNNVAPGTHTASLIDDTLVITAETAKIQVADAAPEDVVLKVGVGGKISGRVTEKESGESVGRVTVQLRPQRGEILHKPVQTRGDGGYEFTGLRPDAYRLSIINPGGFADLRSDEDRERIVTVSVNQSIDKVDFTLFRGLRVSGRVVDEAGNAVGRARVWGQGEKGVSTSATSAVNGSFVLGGFSANEEVSVSASVDGYAVLSITPPRGEIKTGEEGFSGVTILVGEPSSISGIVQDAAGRPKAGVEMNAGAEEGKGFGWASARSAANGSITFKNLGAGEFRVRFQTDGPFQTNSGQKVTLGKAEHVTGLKFVLEEGKLTITGRVTDSQGKPVAGAFVASWGGSGGSRARSDATGAYTITDVGPETQLTLYAGAQGYTEAGLTGARGGDRNVNFVLSAAATIEGRVVNGQTGEPLSAFQIKAQPISQIRNMYLQSMQAMLDPGGEFKLTNVDAGCTKILVKAEGFADTTFEIPAIRAGETRKDVIIRLSAGNELSGRVLNSSGGPVADAKVYTGGGDPSRYMRGTGDATSAADGSFRLSALPSGAVKLYVSHPEYMAKTADVTVSPGAQNRADIVLSTGGVVEGVVRLNGKPIEGQSVGADGDNGSGENLRSKTDTQGRYRIGGFATGKAHLNPSLQIPGRPFQGKTALVDVKDGFVTQKDFDFYSGTATIEGTVYIAPGQASGAGRSVQYWSLREDGVNDYSYAETDDSGSFKFENVPVGQVRLQTSADGNGARVSVTVTVGEGQKIQRDILLYGGATLQVTLSGGSAPLNGWVRLLPGVVDVENAFATDFFRIYANQFVAYAQVRDGNGSVPSVEPGTYTVIAGASGAWGTATVDVKQDQEATVTIALTHQPN